MLALALITLTVLSGFAGSNFMTATILAVSFAVLAIADNHPTRKVRNRWASLAFTGLLFMSSAAINLLGFYGGKELALIFGS